MTSFRSRQRGRDSEADHTTDHTVEQSPPELDITRRIVHGTRAITVTGEVDMETAPTLESAVTTTIDTAGADCILDLTEVTFLNSTGLTALLTAATHAEAQRKSLRIVVDSNRAVIRPIQITGLDTMLRLYHTVDEALTAGNQPHHPNRMPDPRHPHSNS